MVRYSIKQQVRVSGFVKTIFALLILFAALPSFAAFDFNQNCRQAMQAILDLRFDDAGFMIAEEKRIHPENGYAIYLEHYAESIKLIITEEPQLYEGLMDQLDGRMNAMERLDDGGPESRWLQAEMLFHAGLAQVKFGTRISGASRMFSSYKRIRQHRQDFPDFWQNQKLTGIYNLIFDHIPPFMRWAADMFGLSGNAEIGLYQLRRYTEQALGTTGLEEEAVLITNLGYKLAKQEAAGMRFLEEQPARIRKNNLYRYLYASSATFNYRNDVALRFLDEIHNAKIQVSFYSLDYITGRCKLNRLDGDANVHLEKFLKDYPGLDYKKDICIRLSYYYQLQGNREQSEAYRAMVRTVGQDLRDKDKEALLEAASQSRPLNELLKARLLCDGGYFDTALAILADLDPSSLEQKADQLEYHYRKGRIFQLQGRTDGAIHELTKAYDDGQKQPFTFATRSALQLGKIYEDKKDYTSAAAWYQRCLSAYSSSHTTEGVKDDAERRLKRVKSR